MASPKGLALIAVGGILLAAALLTELSLSAKAAADGKPVRNCRMDAIERSICIYEAILSDVSKTYRPRGGGGITGIVQKSTTAYDVQIAQEGRKDILTYTVEVGPDGKVKIVGKTESTQSY
jgi:hypothetical protein